MPNPCVEVLIDDAPITPAVRGALERLNADVFVRPFAFDLKPRARRRHDARLVITHDARAIARTGLPALIRHCEADPCATLVLGPEPGVPGADESLIGPHAIDFADVHNTDDLAGRLSSMCRIQRSMTNLRGELERLRRKEAAESAELEALAEQIRLARQVQQDLLPRTPPRIRNLELHAWFAPADQISGDTYDVYRLDESNVAFSLADATGHGIPAALLGAFVKRSMNGKVVTRGRDTLLEPAEVLTRLNREMLGLGLSQCQFLAALYATYDERTRVLRWARGGCPYPVVMRRGTDPVRRASDGPLIGVIPDAAFAPASVTLGSGDVVLFYTDGLEDLANAQASGNAAWPMVNAPWFAALRSGDWSAAVSELESMRARAVAEHATLDDITIIALRAHA